jgi:signal transduction histidine kinase
MYYTIGIWLIYAGVVLRVFVRYAGLPQRGLVMLLFALYGLLLLIEPFLRNRVSRKKPGFSRRWPAALYLLVQTGLVVALFSIPPHVDFFAGLFVPLSLQAVLFFGRRLGFLCIAIYPVAMFVALTANMKGWPFALIMSLFAGGLFFLFGSYAHQVQKAERAHGQNQRRLARELHDSVTQTVFSMNLTVQSARLLLAKDPGRAEAQLRRLEELASSAMAEIQALVSQLHPLPTAQEGLKAALRQLAAERQVRDGVQVALDVDGERALPEAVAAGLYRIVQEALTNVVKHAGTCEATVRLNLGGDCSFLEVEDHGLGFDPQALLGQQGHLGLAGMAERAQEIGWNLAVDSRPGLGTRIRVEENRVGGRG